MARPSDKEYALHRKIRELEEQNRKLEAEIIQLKKKLDKATVDEPKKYVKPRKESGCPSCGADLQTTVLPFGRLKICKAACGFREVIHD